MIPPSKEKKNPNKRRKVVTAEGIVKISENDPNNKGSAETDQALGAKNQQVQLKMPKERALISGQTINLIMQLGMQEGNV